MAVAPGTVRSVATPPGSGGTAGGLAWLFDSELDFGATSPLTGGFMASCKSGAGLTPEEASGTAFATTGEVESCTTSGIELDIVTWRGLETRLGTALGSAVGTVLGTSHGRVLRPLPGSAFGTPFEGGAGSALKRALETTFETALGTFVAICETCAAGAQF